MKKILAGIFVPMMIAAAASAGWCQEKVPLPIVTRVIDGDTLELSNGEIVRLLGIDCEENEDSSAEAAYLNRGKKWERGPESLAQAKASADFVRGLIEGKQVRLEYDTQKKDQNGRTLAYVFVEMGWLKGYCLLAKLQAGIHCSSIGDSDYLFLNATLVKAGYAIPFAQSPNVKHQDLFVKLEKQAREHGMGIWK